jgi:(1->4)-alpha-D-glucan 1-alpha-D-glucosylmutase
MPSPLAAPISTYRLQLRSGFGFAQVRDLLSYFAELGVSHLYLSPIWRARPGSTHGYDICDPSEINPELGGEGEFRDFSREAAALGIGLILDFVPNHTCADSLHNAAWRDTLRNGLSTPYSEYFDIDWSPVKPELKNKVLLPILGRQYGEVLEAGELQIGYDSGDFHLHYWSHDLPLNPRQCRFLLRHRLDELAERLGDEDEALQEYKSIIFQLEHLPAYTEISAEAREDRLREAAVARQRLARLTEETPEIRQHIERTIQEFNGEAGVAHSFDALHDLLELQVYRLSYWRTAMHEINYRRFFDINDLAGIRMESPVVFEAAHSKAFELLREGLAHGLRLDHVDGLYSPSEYFHQLRESLVSTAPNAYIVVEKILSTSEPLNEAWPVDGTTGYEFLNHVNRLSVRGSNLEELRRIYRRFTRSSSRFDQIVYSSKQQIIATSMASELNVLAHELNRISEGDRRSRDFTLDSLQEALREVVACFPVYRTYITEGGASQPDCRAIDQAIRIAIERNPAMESSVMEFIRENLYPERAEGEDDAAFLRRLRFAMKFQQYTGPVQAKGIEDTAFYRYTPLVSLNEVGGHPSHLGSPVPDFHAANAYRAANHPRSMITTATHDTKRGEDARVRLNVLSEIPQEWRKKLFEWSRLTASARTRLATTFAPDRNDEFLFYQNLLAAWPPNATEASPELIERLSTYMAKAVKEAKVHSSWINPSNNYDAGVARYVERVLGGKESARFLRSFAPFARKVALFGEWNALAQLTLKIASPGVADFYQGTEFWDLSLVDPDNRRPVDFEIRRHWLPQWRHHVAHCRATNTPFFADDIDGRGPERKAAVTAQGLEFRRRHRDLVIHGEYFPLEAAGPAADCIVAFARHWRDQWAVAAIPRWLTKWSVEIPTLREAVEPLTGTFVNLPAGAGSEGWVDVLSNEMYPANDRLPAPALFRYLPGALLVASGDTLGA